MNNRRTFLIAAIGVVVMCSIIIYWRGFRPLGSKPEYISRAEDSAQLFSKLAMTPLLDRSNIQKRLQQGDVQRGDAESTDADAMIDVAASFLAAYYLADTVDQYKSWRRSSGCSLLNRNKMLNADHLLAFYQHVAGESLPDNATDDETFDRFWQASRNYRNGVNRAVKISEDGSGVAVTLKRLIEGNVNWPTLQNATFSASVWYGGRAMGSRRWWACDSLTRETGQPAPPAAGDAVGVVGAVLEFENGSRYPVIISCIRRAGSSSWQLMNVGINNFLDGPTALEF